MNASDRLITDSDGIRISRLVASVVPPGSSVLDIGCGNRMLYDAICEKADGGYYMGLDIDHETLRKLHGSLEVRPGCCRCDFSDISLSELPAQSFDNCICSRLFHHLDRSSALHYLAEMTRITKTGGRLIVVDYVRDYSNRKDHFLYLPDFFMANIPGDLRINKPGNAEIVNDLHMREGDIWMLVSRKDESFWDFTLNRI